MLAKRFCLALSAVALAGCFATTPSTPEAAPVADTATPSGATFNPLRLGTRMNFAPNIETVAQASTWLLQPTGYRLHIKSTVARRIAAQPMSPLALPPRYTTIEDALLYVLGGNNRLVVDHDNRLVSFEPAPAGALAATTSN